MARSLKGDSVEENQLAQLLEEVLKSAGVKPVQLADLLRPEQFLSGQVPSQATIYRRLEGKRLMEGDDLIEAILGLSPVGRRDGFRRRVNALLNRHRENPTPLPPLSTEQSDSLIADLKRDLANAEREKAAMLKAADDEIAGIRRALEGETARRAAAEQAAEALRPLDPHVEAAAIEEKLAELRNSGRLDEFDVGILNVAADTHPKVLVALLGKLERSWKDRQPISNWRSEPVPDPPLELVALATAIGRHRYFEGLPEIARGLDKESAGTAWRICLREAGSRHFDELVWLLRELPSEYGGSGHVLHGVGQYAHLTTWKEMWYSASRYGFDIDTLLEGAVATRPTSELLEMLQNVFIRSRWGYSSRDDYLQHRWISLEEAVGRYRPVDSFPDVIAWLRVGARWDADRHALKTACLDRAPNVVVALVAALRQAGLNKGADEMLATMASDRYDDPYRASGRGGGVARVIAAFQEVGCSPEAEKLLAMLPKVRSPVSFGNAVKALRTTKQELALGTLLAQAARQRRPRRRGLKQALRDQDMDCEAGQIGRPWWSMP